MMFQCWTRVADDGPTLKQQMVMFVWKTVSFFIWNSFLSRAKNKSAAMLIIKCLVIAGILYINQGSRLTLWSSAT